MSDVVLIALQHCKVHLFTRYSGEWIDSVRVREVRREATGGRGGQGEQTGVGCGVTGVS